MASSQNYSLAVFNKTLLNKEIVKQEEMSNSIPMLKMECLASRQKLNLFQVENQNF